MNIGQEFQNYYVNHLGKGSLDLHNFSNQIQSSMTPYILEEREMRATQIDIFSRLMRDRIIWVAGPVDDRMSTIVQAQLMFMDNVDKTDITMHIDSPGGSVKSGLSIVDVMDYIVGSGNQRKKKFSKIFKNNASSIFRRFWWKYSRC